MFSTITKIFIASTMLFVIPLSSFAKAQPISGLDISVKCHGNIPPCPKKPYTYKIYQGLNKIPGSFTIEKLTPGVSHSIYINGSQEPYYTFTPKNQKISGTLILTIDKEVVLPSGRN